MSSQKRTLKFLITPNYDAPYDRRMVNGLANGFRIIDHQAYAVPAPISAGEVARKCKDLSIDVVIQINRTRDPNVTLPPKVRYISWFQDVFPETLNGFAECFNDTDILYALGDAKVLGLNQPLPCYVGSLVSGVDENIFNYKRNVSSNQVDFSLCGFIPTPLPSINSLFRYVLVANPRYNTSKKVIKAVNEFYQPLTGALDIHALSRELNTIFHYENNKGPRLLRLLDWLARKRRKSSFRDKKINYFTREYPRLLDRVILIEKTLKVSNSIELFGPGWIRHKNLRPYAKGVINTQEGLLEIYRRSRINLANNTHGLGLHSRTLECMAVGGFILMHNSPHDFKPGGMQTSFEPGVHYGSFSPETFIEEAEYWLTHDKKRLEAGLKVAEIVQANHRWCHRAMQIVNELKK